MKKRFEPVSNRQDLRDKLIGLGRESLRKSYYPELQKQLERLQDRVELAELVAEIGQALTEEQNLRSAMQRCTDTLEQRTDANFVRIWTLDVASDTLILQASSGLNTSIEGQHSRIKPDEYPFKIGVIARERQPLLTNQVQNDPHFDDQDWIARKKIVAFAGYPLVLQQHLVGVIALFARKSLNETLLDTLSTIADQIAVGIERFQALAAYKAALDNARESMETVNVILRSVADALLVIDQDQTILHMNQAAEALFGTALISAFNKRVAEVTREPALLDYLARIEQFIDLGNDIDLALTDRHYNEQRVFQARASRLRGRHSGSGLVLSLRDVTQDREVARLKTEFIMTAAHELRTPLTTIMGFADILYNEACDAPTQQEYLSYILDKTESLEQIIDELLDLSRIESGRGLSLNYSEWNIRNTLEKFMLRYRTEFRDYRFKASIADDLGVINADHGKIVQVLDNLLSNAIKYSPKGTEINLAAECRGDCLCLRISDQGIGMTEQQLSKCFEKFYRVDTSTTAVGGLGLGLSIVRQVVESHHGTIEITSRPGAGTTATIILPRHRPAKNSDL